MKLLEKIKQFWIVELKKYSKSFFYGSYKGNSLGKYSNWEEELKGKKTLKEIHDYSYEVASAIWNRSIPLGSKLPGVITFSNWETFILWEGKKIKLEDYYKTIMEEFNDYEQQLTQVQTDYVNLKSQADNHKCPVSCSHTDYESIKSQKDSLASQITGLTNKKNSLETEVGHLKEQLGGQTDFDKIKQDIAKQIINDGKLDLDKGSSLEQIITKINELVKKNTDNLNAEELKQEILQKSNEISKLKSEIQKSSSNNNNTNYTPWLLGLGSLSLVGFVIYLVVRWQKKKKTVIFRNFKGVKIWGK